MVKSRRECFAEGGDAGPSDVGRCLGPASPGVLSRPRVIDEMRGGLYRSGVAVLCAEPGMGKTTAARELVLDQVARGFRNRELSLSGLSPHVAADRAVRFAHDCIRETREGRPDVVLVDDVPAGDEECVDRFARAIGRLRAEEVPVIVAVRPECEQLVAELGSTACLRAAQLLVRDDELNRWGQTVSDMPPSATMRLTHGIPLLLQALRMAPRGRGLGPSPSPHYDSALSCLVSASLRTTLMDEERALRGAMILLGHGAVGELGDVGARVDEDVMQSIQRDAPLFGVDLASGEFDCCGARAVEGMQACLETVPGLFGEWPAIARGCAELLVGRREFRRAGLVIRKCLDASERTEMALEWPVEFINVGEFELVEGASASRGKAGRPHGFGRCVAEMAAASLAGDDKLWGEARDRLPDPRDGRECVMAAQASLLQESRRLYRELPAGECGVSIKDMARADTIVGGLLCHVSARRLLLEGKSREAFRMLLVSSEGRDGSTLVSSLLCNDFDVARCLVGDPPSPSDDVSSRRAAALLSGGGLRGCGVYQSAIHPMLAVAVGRSEEFEGAERAAARADRRGDRLTQALLMLVASMADVRHGAMTRAHIRASRAKELSEAARAHRIAEEALLVDVAARASLGERSAVRAAGVGQGDGSSSLGAIGRVLAMACLEDDGGPGGTSASLEGVPCPQDCLPLLDLIARGCGRVSKRVSKTLPEAWGRALDGFEKMGDARYGGPASRGRGQTGRGNILELDSATASPIPSLDVSLLGGFIVRRDGAVIPDDRWKRRAARSLLELLVISRNHMVARSRALEIIWPEGDYVYGRGNLYTALSSLKSTIGQARDKPAFITGAEGTIRLNAALVRCDVDEFEAAAGRILRHDGEDGWTVQRCREVEELYAGDLYLPAYETTGLFAARRTELRRTYADVMVAGAEAALQLGVPRQAIWFAQDACRADEMREDAAMVLVKSLFISNRSVEAREAYDCYSRRLIESTGLPPSARMRGMYGEMCGGAGAMAPRRLESASYGEVPVARRASEEAGTLAEGDGRGGAPGGPAPVRREWGRGTNAGSRCAFGDNKT